MYHLLRSAQRAHSLFRCSSSALENAGKLGAASVAGAFSLSDQLCGEWRRVISSTSFKMKENRDREGSGDKDGDEVDEDEEGGKKRGRKKQIEITDEEIANEPMDYYFGGVPPDPKAALLSSASKEKMWLAYQDNSTDEMVVRLAQQYKIRKQRVHAILWLKEIAKKEEAERGTPLDDDIEKMFEQLHGCYDTADNERHYALPRTAPNFTVMTEGWEGTVKDDSQNLDEVSAKEEAMMVEEFEQRMAFNKLQIAGVIKNDKLSRIRPAEGWSYLIEELGEAGKRGRRGGRRYVAQPDGSHRGLNNLEKMFLKRETVRPRRRVTPK